MPDGLKYIQLPDSTYASFPDTMSDDDIASVIQKQFPPQGNEDFSGATSGAATSQPSPLAKLGGAISDVWTRPGESINRGLYQMAPKDRAPNPLAGGLNILSGAAQTASAPLSTLSAMVDQIPEEIASTNPMVYAAKLMNSAAGKVLGPVGEYAQNIGTQGVKPVLGAIAPFLGQGGIDEVAQPYGELFGMGVQLAAGNAVGSIPGGIRSTGKSFRGAADRVMGSALKTGENLPRAKELARFANENKLTLSEAGEVRAQNIVQSLQFDINEGIINPLTSNGMFVKRTPILEGLRKIRTAIAEDNLIPDPSALKRVDKRIASLESEIQTKGEYMTPRAAQDFKVKLNSELEQYYAAQKKTGKLTPKENADVRSLVEANKNIRSQLEELHPELRGINWEEGKAIEVRKAIEDHLQKKFKGELSIGGPGWTGAVGGRLSNIMSLSAYDLLGSRSFRSKLATLLDKVGRSLSGQEKKNITRLKNPVQPNPPPAGLLKPWSGSPVPEGGYRSWQVPIPAPPAMGVDEMVIRKAKPKSRYGGTSQYYTSEGQ